MQIKKEERAGALYLMSMYSAGVLPGSTPRARAERRRVTSEAKTLINRTRRKYGLMLLIAANFVAGRDLFVYLGWAHEPSEEDDRCAMRNFHRRMTQLYEKMGIAYLYIDFPESHSKGGEPCRKHHHLIIRGNGRRMLGRIMECWGQGSVDVRALREVGENYEDTCTYVLKERKEKGKRAYNCSKNLRRPPEPLRRKVPDSLTGEVPDGVTVIKHYVNDTMFGRYETLEGRITDKPAFDRYWRRAQRDLRKLDEREYWRSRATKTARRLAAEQPPISQETGSNFSPG